MQYNATNILTGIFLLFLFSYILVTLFNFIYVGLSDKGHNAKAARIFLASAIVSLAWIGSTFLAIWLTASVGILAFTIFSLLLIFGVNYLLVEKLLSIDGKHKIIYSVLFAVIFNPAWLTLVGLL